MTNVWTTAAILKKRCKYLNTTDLDDTELGLIIDEAESVVESVIRKKITGMTTTTFDVEKHGLVRAAVTDYATLTACLYDTDEFVDNDQMSLFIASLIQKIKIELALLADTKRVDFISDQ
jgi:hypothetical protein